MKKNYTRLGLVKIWLLVLCLSSRAQVIHELSNTGPDVLKNFIEDTTQWEAGDIIRLTGSSYTENGAISIYQDVTIQGDDSIEEPPTVNLIGNGFIGLAKNITIEGIRFDGINAADNGSADILLNLDGNQNAELGSVKMLNIEAWGFRQAFQGNPKNRLTRLNELVIDQVIFHDFSFTEYLIDQEKHYIKHTNITNSTFYNINSGFLTNFGYQNTEDGRPDLVLQTVTIDHNTFYNFGMFASRSLLQTNDAKDGSLTVSFTNNVVSTLGDNDQARPFRIGVLSGNYTFENSIFHDFNTVANGSNQDNEGNSYNLGGLIGLSHMTVTNVDTAAADPMFKNVITSDNYDFGFPAGSDLLTAGKDGEPIGDPRWNPVGGGGFSERVHLIPNDPDSLEHFLETRDENNIPVHWNSGDTIMLSSGAPYIVNGTIDLYQEVTIMGDPSLSVRPTLIFYDNGFRAKEDSINITLKGFNIDGWDPVDSANAAYILRFDQAVYKNYKHILIEDMEAYNTQGGVQLYKNKNSMYESVVLNRVFFHDMETQWVLDPSLNAIRELKITNSTFVNIKAFLKNVYNNNNGDRDDVFGDVQQNITVDHNTFFRVISDILIQTNDSRDGQIVFNWTNNIVSTILDSINTRPFRIEHNEGGIFTFKNSVFHAFESALVSGEGRSGYNLDSLSGLSNVTISSINSDYPGFADTTQVPYNLTFPLNSPLLSFGTDGGPIGDPRWFPEVGVKIVLPSEAIEVTDTVNMTANVIFGEGIDASVSWRVENITGEGVIDESSGQLVAMAEGVIKVIAVSNFSQAFNDTLEIEIEPLTLVSSIGLIGKNAFGTETNKITNPGGSLTVGATVFPANAANRNIIWSFNDSTLVDGILDGTSLVLSGKKSGLLIITVTADDGSGTSETFHVELTGQSPVDSIIVLSENDLTEIKVGESLQMTARVFPDNADVDSVEWKVGNKAIATIDAFGLLKGVSSGNVKVIAIATDRSFQSDTLEIKVISVLGIKPSTNLAAIHPNPVTGFLKIELKNSAQVKVMSLDGKVVFSKFISTPKVLDLRGFRSGIYIMEVRTPEEIQTIKFVKQ